MESNKKDRRIYKFLIEHYTKKRVFTKEEFRDYVGYEKPETFNTYYSKKLQDFIISSPMNPEKLYVSDIFRHYSRWEIFKNLFSQRLHLKAGYERFSYDNVIIYEFFMPMTNERILRSSLDNLFYKDTIEFRLKTIPMIELEKIIPRNHKEDEEYIDYLCQWISNNFCGYSIETVYGRFKVVDNIMSFEEAGKLLSEGKDYLIDETTAIVRFLFPIGNPKSNNSELKIDRFNIENQNVLKAEAKKIRFFFENLFVQSILEIVNGEDEIWMVENGIRKRLHIFKSKNS